MIWSTKLYIKPKPVQSIRFGGFHNKKVDMYKLQLKGLLLERKPKKLIDFPVRVDMLFWSPSKGPIRWDTRRRDITNYRKAVEDAMNEVIIKDDSLICAGFTGKVAADTKGEIWIQISKLQKQNVQSDLALINMFIGDDF